MGYLFFGFLKSNAKSSEVINAVEYNLTSKIINTLNYASTKTAIILLRIM